MARALRIQFPNAVYHITCRGVERRPIYVDNKDREQFINLLQRSLENYQVLLHAYILMDNHFHLLIQTPKANCAEFMRHFNISYTGWFNRRYQRCGNLYQGRYKAFLVDVDNYLLEVSRYLHLNCVRVSSWVNKGYLARWRYVQGYCWSSLGGYLYKERVLPFMTYGLILGMVGGRRGYCDFIRDGLRRGVESPFGGVRARVILGTEEYVKKVKNYLRRGSVREQPGYREIVFNPLAPVRVLDIVAEYFGVSVKRLKESGGYGEVRGVLAELMYRYCDTTQSAIGEILGGIDYGAVYLLRRRLRERMDRDANLRKRYTEVEAKVRNECRM
ncbi:MAG: transposase [candidate division WOR-3 bacterium]